MTVQYSVAVANAMLDSFEAKVGPSPILRMYTGAAPANLSAAVTGSLLVEIALPADWMADAANGSKAKAGTWSAAAKASGTAGYYRLFAADGTTAHAQGSLSMTGGGGDMVLDNTNIATLQIVSVTTFSMNFTAS